MSAAVMINFTYKHSKLYYTDLLLFLHENINFSVV